MNYYHELLESYSKLKKRSLKLIAEGSEAAGKKKEAAEKKEAARQAALKNALPLAIAAAEAGKGMDETNATKPPAAFPPDTKVYKNSGTGNVLYDNGSQQWTLFASLGDGKLKSTYSEGDFSISQKAWTKFTSAFIDPDQEEGTETEADIATRAENAKAAKEEAALTANTDALAPIEESILAMLENDKIGDYEEEGYWSSIFKQDVGPEGIERGNLAGFKQNIEATFNKWIKDISDEVSLEEKEKSAKNLKKLIEVAGTLFHSMDQGGPLKQEDKDSMAELTQAISLITTPKKRKKDQTDEQLAAEILDRQGFILNERGPDDDEVEKDPYEILVFGTQMGGQKLESKWKKALLDIFSRFMEKWNKADLDGKDQLEGFGSIEIGSTSRTWSRTGAGSSDARGKADEFVMAGAGEVASLINLDDQIEAAGDDKDLVDTLKARKKWHMEMLKRNWNNAKGQMDNHEASLSKKLGKGLRMIDGIEITSIGSLDDEALAKALIKRLVISYPDSFNDEEEARAFVETLTPQSIDEEEVSLAGMRAFATFLLLREDAVRSFLGAGVPSFSVQVGDVAQNTKGERVKRDVMYALDPENLNLVKDQLRGNVSFSHIFHERTIATLMGVDGMIPEDFPPGTFAGDAPTAAEKKQTFTMLQVSLKSVDSSNSVSVGSYAPATIVAQVMVDVDGKSEGKPIATRRGHRKTARNQLLKSGVIGSKGNSKGLPTSADIDTFFGGIRDAVGFNGKRAPTQGTFLWGEIKKLYNGTSKGPPSDLEGNNDRQRALFKAVASELFTLAGTASHNQLNVTNELDTGQTSMESDEVFRNTIQQGIGKKDFIVQPAISRAQGRNANANALEIVCCITKAQPDGVVLVRIKKESRGRISAEKTSAYTEKYGKKKNVSENKDSLMTDFLKAQATLIQELLATH